MTKKQQQQKPKKCLYKEQTFAPRVFHSVSVILGDPGADSGGEGKSKRAGKYGTKKSKERREEPLGDNVLHKSFLAPIKSQNGDDRLELVW